MQAKPVHQIWPFNMPFLEFLRPGFRSALEPFLSPNIEAIGVHGSSGTRQVEVAFSFPIGILSRI